MERHRRHVLYCINCPCTLTLRLSSAFLSSPILIPTGDDKGDEEAEYAWLPYDNIKPFALGDVSGNNDGQAPEDPVLLASVAAAEAALRAATTKQQQQAANRAASGFAAAAGALDASAEGSDSDGGWGVSREVGSV
jgi:hypothetical protein